MAQTGEQRKAATERRRRAAQSSEQSERTRPQDSAPVPWMTFAFPGAGSA